MFSNPRIEVNVEFIVNAEEEGHGIIIKPDYESDLGNERFSGILEARDEKAWFLENPRFDYTKV